jgi:hypothetical protein
MRTALDAPRSALNEHEVTFVDNIREHGWFDTYVFSNEGEASFSYTTGFWVTLGAPEIVVFSLDRIVAHDVLWDIFRDVRDGKQIKIGRYDADVFANGGAYFFPVARKFYPKFLGWSRWFYGNDEFPCLQLVWPDRQGNFLWQDGFEVQFRDDQPDLSEDSWVKALVH